MSLNSGVYSLVHGAKRAAVLTQIDDVLEFIEGPGKRSWRPVVVAAAGFLVAAAALANSIVPVLRDGLADVPATTTDTAEILPIAVSAQLR